MNAQQGAAEPAVAMAQDGILPAHAIQALIAGGGLELARPADDDQVQPASLDLRLGETAYRLRASFLPGPGRTVAEALEDVALHEFSLKEGAVLETGCGGAEYLFFVP